MQQTVLDSYFQPGIVQQLQSSQRRLCNFSKDPYLITHPLYATHVQHRHRGFSNTIGEQTSSLLSLKTAKVHRFGRAALGGSLPRAKGGTNVISIDHEEALIAAGFESGTLSVFDLDEAQISFRNAERSCELEPVAVVSAGRSISSVCWSPLRADEIAVSFCFSSQIRLYDLSVIEDRHSPPQAVYEVSGMKKECGNRVMRFVCFGEQQRYLVAGSVSGFLRVWNLARSSLKTWSNFLADPSRSAHTGCAVVGIFYWHDGRVIVVMEDATICVYDMQRWRSPAFGAGTYEPTLLDRFHPRCREATVGLGMIHAAHEIALGVLALAEPRGRVFVVDCARRAVVRCVDPFPLAHLSPRSAIASTTGAAAPETVEATSVSVLSLDQLRDLHRYRSAEAALSTHLSCAIWRPDLVGPGPVMVCMQHNRLALRSLASSNLTHLANCAGARSAARLKTVSLPRTEGYALTLQTTLAEAVPGEMLVTLRGALAPEMAAAINLQCVLRCEWLDPTALPAIRMLGIELVLLGAQAGKLILQGEYCGPEVREGTPRVFLRMKSLPASFPSALASSISSKLFDTCAPALDPALGYGMALAVSPNLPFVFVGDREERLSMIPIGALVDPVDEEPRAEGVDGDDSPPSKRQRIGDN